MNSEEKNGKMYAQDYCHMLEKYFFSDSASVLLSKD